MTLKEAADKYIPASDGKKVLKKDGNTNDIVAEVIAAFKESREQLRSFAPHLKAATLQQTLNNVWKFWKGNIRYEKDPDGIQLVQEPKALWADKVGDCKSLSVAVMGTLNCLGIKAAFRFTSYGDKTDFPTHVYVVVQDKGKVIPVDCVWKEYGTQKPFSKNWDYNMTSIYRVSGFEDTAIGKRLLKTKHKKMPKRGVLHFPKHKPVTHAMCDVLLHKQRLELEQKIYERQKGITGVDDQDSVHRAYEMQITGIHNAVAEYMEWPRVKLAGYDAVGGISCLPANSKEAQTVEAIEGFFGSIFKGIKAIGKGIGKGAKGAFKVFKKFNPISLAVKGAKAVGKGVGKFVGKILTGPARTAVLEQLPQTAPFFLYTFITDPKLIAKLPQAVKIKRDKALEYKNTITGKLQITASNFDGTVRNGIMNTFGLSPENVIAKWIKDTNFQVGFLQALIPLAGGLVSKLFSHAGEHLGEDAQTYAPAPEDWGTINESAKAEYSNDVQQQPTNMRPLTESQLYNQVQQTQQPQYSTPGYAGGGSYQPDFSGGGTTGDDYGKTGGGDYPDTGSSLAKDKTLDNVDIITGKKRPIIPGDDVPTESNNGGIMIAAAAGLLFVAMASKPKGKKRA